jgi:osmoprotectant transport system substrate-binding protein
MRMIRGLALGASMLALLSACTTGGGGTSSPSASASSPPSASAPASESAEPSAPTAPISIGSDGFYESQLMAEIYAQVLEGNGYTVERNLGLGAREVSAAALESGQIDLKPEYIGSGLGFYKQAGLTDADPTGDPEETSENLATALESIDVSVLGYTPGEDTNAFVVRQDTATEHGLATITDLAGVADQLKWGLPPECATNPLCGGALSDAYDIDVAALNVTPLAACDVPIAEALNGGAIDVAELCSTQPAIEQFGFVVLEDDQDTQPAENIAPVVRNDYLEQVDPEAFQALLDAASDKMTTEELTRLGVLVAVEQEEVADVAATWLQEQGLVSG